jgi:multidrug efflux pump subunit AcrA (membrane-fusion protein)
VILASGAAVFATLKATRPEQKPVQMQERIWRVEVQAAEPGVLTPSLTLYGRLQTPDLLKAAASASARVEKVLVRDGDRVKQGQLLVQLDERDFRPRLAQARAEVAELEAQIRSEMNRHQADIKALEQEQKLLEIARAAVGRANRLYKQKLGSDSDLDAAEEALARQALAVTQREMDIADHPARLQALQARLAKAKAGLQQITLDYERSAFVAPYAGVITDVVVTAGDQVKEDAVLIRMYSLDSLEVRARIPAPYQDEVRAALAQGVTLLGEAQLGGRTLRLRLMRLSGESDPSGVDGLFRLESGAEWLRLGQVIRFQLQRPPQRETVAIPLAAVYGGDRIYTLADGRLQGIRVEALGVHRSADEDERLLVRSAQLQAGDLIVVTHLPNAVDGLRAERLP